MKNQNNTFLLYGAIVFILGILFGAWIISFKHYDSTNNKNKTPQEDLLFVQNSSSGHLSRTKNGSYILDLANVPETIYFAEEPYRDGGLMATKEFNGMLLKETDKDVHPNAILQLEYEGEKQSYLVEINSSTFRNQTIKYMISIMSKTDRETGDINLEDFTEEQSISNVSFFIDAFPTAVNSQITDSITKSN